MIDRPKIKVGFVGFGEVNSPRELIEQKCAAARQALLDRGLEVVSTAPVSDDPEQRVERRAIAELSAADFDLLVVCVAGWIPSHTVIDVITTDGPTEAFAQKVLSQHYIIAYGDHRAALTDLCGLLGIEVV